MTDWRKSTRSGSSSDEACVEVARLTSGIGVRDSKNPHAGHHSLTPTAFTDLVRKIKRHELDL
jgi:uncharacterized protein DUF397